MKQIVNGILYDTSKATLIANYDNGLSDSDFKCCYEELYLTKKGNWFLYCEGGPLSIYGKRLDNGDICGNHIINSLDSSEVIEWLERENKIDLLEKYFPNSIEDA